MLTRQDVEARERRELAPYAAKSAESRGRQHPEPEHEYRTAYQRDRDRIVHSTAFRRLEYKTQVFLTHEGDYFRTRLTHTLEVAQIARTLARALNLNEDLTEAVALAHDLGHTPFGHAGEETLRELMAGHGGFEHNRHGVRIIDILEHPYPQFRGLNLTYEVRECIAKHATPYDASAADGFAEGWPPLDPSPTTATTWTTPWPWASSRRRTWRAWPSSGRRPRTSPPRWSRSCRTSASAAPPNC